MTKPEAVLAFLSKFGCDYVNVDALVHALICSPHANMEVAVDGGGEVVGGKLWFSFLEMDFAIVAELHPEDWNTEFTTCHNIYSRHKIPGGTELIPGWWHRGPDAKLNALASLYYFYVFCRGFENPTASEEFMAEAAKLKEAGYC